MGLARGTKFKIYTSLAKSLKLKVRKFCVIILTFVEVAGEKLVGNGGYFNRKITSNKTKHLVVENKLKKLKIF